MFAAKTKSTFGSLPRTPGVATPATPATPYADIDRSYSYEYSTNTASQSSVASPRSRDAQHLRDANRYNGDAYGFALVKSGPDVDPNEVEMPHVASVEVMILWGSNVLHVQHLTPPRSFFVGEEDADGAACEYLIPAEKLGTTRAPIVLADAESIRCVVLPGAACRLELAGQPPIDLREAVRTGRAVRCGQLSGSYEITLPAGAKARIETNGLVFQVAAVPAGKRVPTGLFASSDSSRLLFTGFSGMAHVGLVGAMAFFVPPIGLTEDEGLTRDRQYLIQQYLQAAAERDAEARPAEAVVEDNADEREGGKGQRSQGEEGSAGNPTSKQTGKRFGVQGPRDNPDPHLARDAALREAAEIGILGLLHSGAGGNPAAPTSPWGRDDFLGTDPRSALGNMWGTSIEDSFGAGGLGLSGIGEAGGGRFMGIGLGAIGTIGHGSGTGDGDGWGSGRGRLRGGHNTRVFSVRPDGVTQVNGRLPPEVIQRIVRQNFGRFRLCYENGLRSNPNLQGRVAVRFAIGRDGSVMNVANGGSDLPDASVVQCVVRSYYGLTFPQPEGGVVTVVYPIMFSPGT